MLDLDRYPRVALCHRPTPLEPMPRITEALGGPTVWVKRDDCTGLAGGGNKTRKLEFLIGEALSRDADMVVTQGATQSNHVRQTAAAACRFGLGCHGLLERRVVDGGENYEFTGNVLLDRVFGATLEFRSSGLDMNAEVETAAEKFRAQGRRPYAIPGGGSNETGALGYVACAMEMLAQIRDMNIKIDWIVVGSGSTGTHAGLLAGLHALGAGIPVMGISVRQKKEPQIKAVHALAEKTLAKIGGRGIPSGKVIVDDGYVGKGYAVPAASTLEAIQLVARKEGILLDPVYTGKAFAGLIGLTRTGIFDANANILFLHTGGSAALFAYQEVLLGAAGDGAAIAMQRPRPALSSTPI
jgi:L-cysteate sulfo-lyase